ncbi:hypothetical protein [Burkholderia cepacia]|uniref:hypothetical protein n=1 Tax=Burkholderia cepacia TaxID=292 RepID=UPI001CF30E01|nr:hypothetical protein [Burkholderia cepacia]MCA8320642.1 hypothetical protein [Burkholderia cepacia]
MSDKKGHSARAKWWEKHVEWEFIRSYVDSARAVLPVDGQYEYGDALFATDESWWILEFKGKKSYKDSERDKYPSTSMKRAMSVARRVYKGDNLKQDVSALEQSLKICKDIVAHRKALLSWEKALLEGASAKATSGVFFRADRAFTVLMDSYQYHTNGITEVPPHLFVYPADARLTRLNGCRYWGEWVVYGDPKFVEPDLDEKDLALHLADDPKFEDFARYIQLLALARGYPDFAPRSDGKSKAMDDDDILFANVLVYGRMKGGSVRLMPLAELLEAMPALFADKRYARRIQRRI